MEIFRCLPNTIVMLQYITVRGIIMEESMRQRLIAAEKRLKEIDEE